MPAKKMKTSPSSGEGYKDLEARISPVSEVPSFLTMLVYGRSGTGKTAFSSTFPKPLLLLDIKEKGTETIAQVRDVDVFSVESWKDFEEAYWYLQSGKHKYKSVVVDQISSLQGLAMDHVRAEDGMEPGELFHKRQWGQVSGMMQTWVLNYRNLWDHQLHVCFIAHERSDEGGDEIDNQIDPSIGPRVMPSLSSFVQGAVSAIGSTFIRERFIGQGAERVRKVDYCMRIGPHAYYATKIRKPPGGNPVPDVLVNPSFDKIVSISKGEFVPKSSLKKVKR